MFSSKTIIYWIELVSASFVVSKSVVQYWRMVLSSSLWKKAYTHYDILFKKLMFCFVGSLSWTLQRSFYFKSPFENCHYCPSSCKMFNFYLLPITSDLWWSPLLSCRPRTSNDVFINLEIPNNKIVFKNLRFLALLWNLIWRFAAKNPYPSSFSLFVLSTSNDLVEVISFSFVLFHTATSVLLLAAWIMRLSLHSSISW